MTESGSTSKELLHPVPEKIPSELKNRAQWVNWCLEERDGKPTKVPYTPMWIRKDVNGKVIDTRVRASTTDLTTWGTFDGAFSCYDSDSYGQRPYDGIGFVFSSGDPFAGIDLDDCRDPETGDIEEWAQELVDGFVGYKELSPTGTGIHIIVRAKVREAVATPKIQISSVERYFTITGWPV